MILGTLFSLISALAYLFDHVRHFIVDAFWVDAPVLLVYLRHRLRQIL